MGVLYCCLGMVKDKRGRRGGQGEDAWSIKFDNVHIQLRIIIKLPVKPNIYCGFVSPCVGGSKMLREVYLR